jgi:hypothetical protein
VCDDPEALEQFEKLFRLLSGGGSGIGIGQVGRNISVFEVKNSDATEIADKLQALFNSTRSSWRRGFTQVSIVPDERLNTIMVQGSRIDRETIAVVGVCSDDSVVAVNTEPKKLEAATNSRIMADICTREIWKHHCLNRPKRSSRCRFRIAPKPSPMFAGGMSEPLIRPAPGSWGPSWYCRI